MQCYFVNLFKYATSLRCHKRITLDRYKGILIISFVYILFQMNVESVKGDSKNSTCDLSFEVCEYWLAIEEKLTMIYNKDLVYGNKGHLYKYYDHWSNASSTVPVEEVITTDGYHRLVIAFNDSIPGPPIIVYEGQMVCIYLYVKYNDYLKGCL